MERVTVIIPYFQREPGLLRRAMDSVLAQTLSEPISVLIIDDASPHPAADELAGWSGGEKVRYQIIPQANTGPGGARNHGLDALARRSEYVAFLDSDDAWAPEHLSRALASLDAGADLYFADCEFEDDEELLMSGLWPRFGDSCTSLKGDPDLWTTNPDTLQMLILYGFMHTPTVVFHYAKWPMLRFPLDYFRFGEDQTFWLRLALEGAIPAFSSRVEAYGGRGVSIYAGASWGTEQQLGVTLHEIRFRRAAIASMNLSAEAQAFLVRLLSSAKASLAMQCLHHLRRGRFALCWQAFRQEPGLLWRLPAELAGVLTSASR